VYTIETKHENEIVIGIVEALMGTTIKGTKYCFHFLSKKN
jgi:hypothetical protein